MTKAQVFRRRCGIFDKTHLQVSASASELRQLEKGKGGGEDSAGAAEATNVGHYYMPMRKEAQ